ncbi:unnamed protein product [Dibothriocephalus latus]|uniref:Fibronectin type-III domain-containing protein n=1 Tax=Dibothriocephalus latus TaxID=60516 RepID=A0A3P7QDN7_DIBLA|nr:unnamed protein product [Dibothriocephalus latus]
MHTQHISAEYDPLLFLVPPPLQVSAFKPNGRGMERQLQFDSLKDVHMGEYMCRASNLYNLDSEGNRVETTSQTLLYTFFDIFHTAAPDPVKFVQNSSRTSATTISLAWQPPAHDGNKPIIGYSIRYYQPDAALDSPQHQGHQATLEGLRPYTKYHIVVTAVNEVGVSTESSLALTTQEASECIMNLGGSSQVRCSLLHGQHDMELTGLPKFTTYAIRVIAINSKGLSPPAFVLARTLEDHETHSVNQVVKGQTTVTLAGLLANTNYTVQVAASNRKGRGPLSPKKSCFTTEAAPDAPGNQQPIFIDLDAVFFLF